MSNVPSNLKYTKSHEWVRVDGDVATENAPMGRVPAAGTFNLEGLDVSDEAMEKLFHVDRNMWTAECDLTEEYFDKFGERVPAALTDELAQLRGRLTT